jgi:hypothetical protein
MDLGGHVYRVTLRRRVGGLMTFFFRLLSSSAATLGTGRRASCEGRAATRNTKLCVKQAAQYNGK